MTATTRRIAPLLAGFLFLASLPLAHADYLEVLKKASVRERPDVRSKRIVRVPKGALLQLKDWRRENDYFRIALLPGDEEGWIHYSVVRKREGDPPTTFRHEAPSEPAASPASAAAASAAPVQREVEVRSQVEPLPVGNPQAFTERAGEGYAYVLDHRTGLPSWAQYELTRESVEGAARLEARFFAGVDGEVLPVLESPGWNALAGAVRGWTAQRGGLTVILGPVFAAEGGRVSYRVTQDGRAVPTHLFKVLVFAPKGGDPAAQAFLFPNDPAASPLIDRALVSIDELEAATGLDLLSALPEDVQEALESEKAGELW